MNDSNLIKFFLDNASGLSVSLLALFFMFRLCDGHLTKVSHHLESLQEAVWLLTARHDHNRRDVERTLLRVEQKLDLHHNVYDHLRRPPTDDFTLQHQPRTRRNKTPSKERNQQA